MVNQYSPTEYAAIGLVPDGQYVSIGDYNALKERHDTFMRDVMFALNDLLTHNAPTPIRNLEAAFMAESHPRD